MTLAEYLNDADEKPSQFAARCRMPASTILRILRGERQARMDTAAIIVAATGGQVTFADLMAIPRAPRAPSEQTGAAA